MTELTNEADKLWFDLAAARSPEERIFRMRNASTEDLRAIAERVFPNESTGRAYLIHMLGHFDWR